MLLPDKDGLSGIMISIIYKNGKRQTFYGSSLSSPFVAFFTFVRLQGVEPWTP